MKLHWPMLCTVNCTANENPKTIKIALFISLVLHKDQFNASENAAMPTDANMLRSLSSDEIVRITNIFFVFKFIFHDICIILN